MVMVLCPGVTHAGQRDSGRTIERVKKWPGVFFIKVPAGLFQSVDLEADLVIVKRDDFALFRRVVAARSAPG